MRVPFLVRWPGTVPAATKMAAPVSHFDNFGTALAAAGVPLPTDRKIDGVDLLRDPNDDRRDHRIQL